MAGRISPQHGSPSSSFDQMQGGDGEVDRLDADKGNDDATEAVDQQITAQQGCGADGAISYAFQRQRNQRDDDQCIEDDRRKDCTLRACEAA